MIRNKIPSAILTNQRTKKILLMILKMTITRLLIRRNQRKNRSRSEEKHRLKALRRVEKFQNIKCLYIQLQLMGNSLSLNFHAVGYSNSYVSDF